MYGRSGRWSSHTYSFDCINWVWHDITLLAIIIWTCLEASTNISSASGPSFTYKVQIVCISWVKTRHRPSNYQAQGKRLLWRSENGKWCNLEQPQCPCYWAGRNGPDCRRLLVASFCNPWLSHCSNDRHPGPVTGFNNVCAPEISPEISFWNLPVIQAKVCNGCEIVVVFVKWVMLFFIHDPWPWCMYLWCGKFVTDRPTDRPILGVGLYFWSLVSVKVKTNSRDASASKKHWE